MPRTNVFRQFADVSWDNYTPTTSMQRDAGDKVATYIADLDYHLKHDMKGLTLIGSPGIGKTMLGHLVLKHAMKLGYSYRAITLEDLVKRHQDFFTLCNRLDRLGRDAPDSEWVEQDKMMKFFRSIEDSVQVLLLDDVGKEYNSGKGWSNWLFDHLLRYRYNYGSGVTLLTSNTPVNQWAERYSESMESFLYETTEVIEMGGNDFRRS